MSGMQSAVSFYEEVYHDLKTPLAVLIANIQMLEQTKDLPKPAEKYVRDIKRSSFRLAKLIHDVNDGARLLNGLMTPRLRNCNIVELVRNICDEIQSLAAMRQISIFYKYKIPSLTIAVDFHFVERILLNILSNAERYSDSGGTVHVMLWADKSYVYISIRDYGPGVSPDTFRDLFKKHATTDGRSGHSGLGMFIINQLAELLNGEISVYGASPGLEVVLKLPVFQVEDEAEQLPLDDFFTDNIVQLELSF